MGIYDRDYTQDPWERGGSYMNIGLGRMGSVVKWLLILNFVVFLLTISQNLNRHLFAWGAVIPQGIYNIQLWRLVTFQFLHQNAMHFLFNMIFLYFFGPILEQTWGSRTFLKFYLACGAAGGIVYTLLATTGILPVRPLIGASGGLYAIMAAVAVLYPRMPVLLYGLIPLRMVWLVVLALILSLLRFTSDVNPGGEAAHLTGLAAGFIYVKYKPFFTGFQLQRRKGNWEKRMEQERAFEAEVDRILKKVHDEGLASLSSREKKILQEATRREQMSRRG